MKVTTSASLESIILEKIDSSASAWIPFSEYMHLALYHKEYGYYASDSNQFGVNHDFVTAPEMGPAFATVIGRQLLPLLQALPNPLIVELGAGSGILASNIISFLTAHECSNFKYEIIDISHTLVAKQKTLLTDSPIEISWNSPIKNLAGYSCIVIANEFLDALPVDRFIIEDNSPLALGVTSHQGTIGWSKREPDENLISYFDKIVKASSEGFINGYTSEYYNPYYFKSFEDLMKNISGLALFIDYGLPEKDYYYRDRSSGTLTCYASHRMHDDPFFSIGLQDITSWVNFTYFSQMMNQFGWKLNGFTTQAEFLIYGGIDKCIDKNLVSPNFELLSQIKTLILPGEMGENIKVMALEKDLGVNYYVPGKSLVSRL